MKNYSAKDVDSYIASSSAAARPNLEELRKIIKSTVPGVVEKISWGIPFYWYHGALAGFASFKNHVGFGFAFAFQNKDRSVLEEKGYLTGKKTIQIRFDQKVPVALIKQMLNAQVKINKAKKVIK